VGPFVVIGLVAADFGDVRMLDRLG